MSEVQTVIVQLVNAEHDGVGTVTEGHFIIENGTLIMTFADGSPVDEMFRHKLKESDNPRAVAGVLTRKVRRHVIGMTEAEETFNRPLGYANAGVA